MVKSIFYIKQLITKVISMSCHEFPDSIPSVQVPLWPCAAVTDASHWLVSSRFMIIATVYSRPHNGLTGDTFLPLCSTLPARQWVAAGKQPMSESFPLLDTTSHRQVGLNIDRIRPHIVPVYLYSQYNTYWHVKIHIYSLCCYMWMYSVGEGLHLNLKL